MLGILTALFKAISAGFGVWKQERAIYNRPDMVKQVLAQQHQANEDAAAHTAAILANPNATPQDHKDALDQYRKMMS